MNLDENEDYVIPVFIFFIATFFMVYVINKVELSTKEETENFINSVKYK